MPHRRTIDIRDQKPLLDVVSLGRPGPGLRDSLALGHIARTVRRVPEVVVKVSGGARTLRGLALHLDYIGRKGDLEIETDDGRRIREEGFEKKLINDWDLDLESPHREQSKWAVTRDRKPPKLVHNVIFSMPPGTPPSKLLAAVRKFAEDRFALQHRYAMVLHTDDDHPHVHVVVKAMSEQGERLNIRKATLREWRTAFAHKLREQGVPANATERAVRGQARKPLKDGIYRAAARGASLHMRRRVEEIGHELKSGKWQPTSNRALVETHAATTAGWLALSNRLAQDGHRDLAEEVRRFADQMPPPVTDREQIARQLLERAERTRSNPSRAR